jgi:hypothetical protein
MTNYAPDPDPKSPIIGSCFFSATAQVGAIIALARIIIKKSPADANNYASLMSY